MQRIDRTTRGVFPVMVTPFTDEGAVDLASLDRLVDFYLSCGAHGLTVLGMMGEAAKLTPSESRAVLEKILARVAGRVPVVVGISQAGLRPLADFAAEVDALGAAGVMIAPIPGLGTDRQVQGYYDAVIAALPPDLPVCLQDFPQATGVQMSLEVIAALTQRHPQVVMLKHEAAPGLAKLTAVRRLLGEDGPLRMSILVGNGGLHVPQELMRGADGIMTGFAYPEMLVAVCELIRRDQADAAEDLYDLYLPLIRHEAQSGAGLAVRKEILRSRGAIASAALRAPGYRLTPEDKAEVARLMQRLDSKLAQHPASAPRRLTA